MEEKIKGVPEDEVEAFSIGTAVETIKAGYIESFAPFEICLRDFDSGVYFVALPLEKIAEDQRHQVVYPWDRSIQPKNTLVSVKGAQLAEMTMLMAGTTPRENLDRLRATGVLL